MARTSASARVLTDHDKIRRWAEERGAKPAGVRDTGGRDDVGMIRLDFPGYNGAESLEERIAQESRVGIRQLCEVLGIVSLPPAMEGLRVVLLGPLAADGFFVPRAKLGKHGSRGISSA